MFNSRSKPNSEASQSSQQPKDALSALMDGNTPDAKSLRFPNERTDSWRGPGSSQSKPPPKDHYNSDYHKSFDSKPSSDEYRPQKQGGGAFDSVKSGAANTGNYIKQKSTTSANYVKEKDWAREKELAGKAGTATKNGAIAVGSGVAKGAGWLWSSTKTGFNSLTDPTNKK